MKIQVTESIQEQGRAAKGSFATALRRAQPRAKPVTEIRRLKPLWRS